eukprot:GHVU01155112.1.p1 GENE.GHVU01155112.1~~GHVU01155112.1.p1  ORF type:complete len:110 (+),score=10.26 GHVU01155112.1:310-639(+)
MNGHKLMHAHTRPHSHERQYVGADARRPAHPQAQQPVPGTLVSGTHAGGRQGMREGGFEGNTALIDWLAGYGLQSTQGGDPERRHVHTCQRTAKTRKTATCTIRLLKLQ